MNSIIEAQKEYFLFYEHLEIHHPVTREAIYNDDWHKVRDNESLVRVWDNKMNDNRFQRAQ
jgi:hypothetical protein